MMPLDGVEDVPEVEVETSEPLEPLTQDSFVWLVAEYPSAIVPLLGLLAGCDEWGFEADEARLARVALEAEEARRVTLWAYEGQAVATLDQEEAREMGLKLTPLSERWVPLGGYEPPPRKDDTPALAPGGVLLLSMTEYEEGHPGGGYRPGDERRPGRRDRVRDDSMWIDPSQPEPIDVITRKEGEECRDREKVPIYLVLGLGLQWPGALKPALVLEDVGTGVLVRSVCKGCKGALRLPKNAYCAICDRSGLDGKIPAVEPELRQGGRRRHDPGKLAGGVGAPLREKARGRQRSA